MKDTLNISCIQAHLSWENPVQNRVQLERFIQTISDTCDLIILPEMFSSGFTMDPETLAETMDGPTVSWMKEIASKRELALCGSIIIEEKESFYNRFLFVRPDGECIFYDKRHLFMMAGEGEKYTAGDQQIIINYEGWKICPQICYDLRFPVFARNVENYDVLIYVANWPKPRIAAWDALLKARAIENMSYCVGVNRVGIDGNGLEYVGHSAVYNVLGELVAFAKAEESVLNVALSKDHIAETRRQLPFLKDMDSFSLD